MNVGLLALVVAWPGGPGPLGGESPAVPPARATARPPRGSG